MKTIKIIFIFLMVIAVSSCEISENETINSIDGKTTTEIGIEPLIIIGNPAPPEPNQYGEIHNNALEYYFSPLVRPTNPTYESRLEIIDNYFVINYDFHFKDILDSQPMMKAKVMAMEGCNEAQYKAMFAEGFNNGTISQAFYENVFLLVEAVFNDLDTKDSRYDFRNYYSSSINSDSRLTQLETDYLLGIVDLTFDSHTYWFDNTDITKGGPTTFQKDCLAAFTWCGIGGPGYIMLISGPFGPGLATLSIIAAAAVGSCT